MRVTYEIGYMLADVMRRLAETDEERAAIARLVDFQGDLGDMELLARLAERKGESGLAWWIKRGIRGECGEVRP